MTRMPKIALAALALAAVLAGPARTLFPYTTLFRSRKSVV